MQIVRHAKDVGTMIGPHGRRHRCIAPRTIAGFPVAVMSQMRYATRNLASSTKTRKSIATIFGNKLDPLHS